MKVISIDEQKQLLTEMMEELHLYCEEKGYRYYLFFGSLLGAVRHQGFIPWDDDLDIAMPRADYEKLIRSYNQDHPKGNLKIMSILEDNRYYLPFAKLVHTKTTLHEADGDLSIGVYIDIFPLDNLGDTKEKAHQLFLNTKSYRKAIMISNWKISKEVSWYKNLVKRILKLRYPVKNRYEVIRKLDKKCKNYQSENPMGLVGALCTPDYRESETMEATLLEPRIKVPFENYEFYIPKQYDAILKHLYGDYMQLPPKEQQITHHIYDAFWIED